MMQFPAWFLSLIVYGGLVIAVIGAVILLSLLARDCIRRSLW